MASNIKKTMTMTKQQKAALVQFLEDHPQLNSGKFTNDFTYKKAKEMWMDLANILNAIPGCQKEWDKWRKTWHDLKNATKAKAASNKKSQNKTGGDISPIHIFDTEESKILNILSPIQIEGLRVPESSTKFDFQNMKNEPLPQIEVINDLGKENAGNNEIVLEKLEPKKGVPKIRENRIKRLNHSIQATEKMANLMSEKINLKRCYMKKKLALLQKDIAAKNRIADELQKVAKAIKSVSGDSNSSV